MESLERHRELYAVLPGGGNAPVVDGTKEVPVLLVGQAARGLVRSGGVSRAEIYLSALARCFPGKARGGGDWVPSRVMPANCRGTCRASSRSLGLRWWSLSGAGHKRVLGIRRLSEAVGETFVRDGVVYVPLPHPSGASTWLNVPENRGRHLRALAVLGEVVAAGRIGGS